MCFMSNSVSDHLNGHSTGQERVALSYARGSLGWILGKNFSEGAVKQWHRHRGGGGVTVPGGVQVLCGCGTEGCGQWAW